MFGNKNKGISEDLAAELDRAAEEGNRLFEQGKIEEAVHVWFDAYKKIPEPKNLYPQSW